MGNQTPAPWGAKKKKLKWFPSNQRCVLGPHEIIENKQRAHMCMNLCETERKNEAEINGAY